MFCLSKGLGAPVGSLLVGSKKFIEQARVYRKALGGGMRQAGVLAAAGLIALEEGPKRLHEDHANAKLLAEGLAKLRGIKIDATKVQTNILVFDISGTGMDSAAFARKLMEKNVFASGISPTEVRIVTHMDVDRSACERALGAITEIYR
jgi:threonine aldolase